MASRASQDNCFSISFLISRLRRRCAFHRFCFTQDEIAVYKTRTDTIDSHTAASVVETLANASPRERAYFPERQRRKQRTCHTCTDRFSFTDITFRLTNTSQTTNTQLPYNPYLATGSARLTHGNVFWRREALKACVECACAHRSRHRTCLVGYREYFFLFHLQFSGVSSIMLALPNYACWYVLTYVR